MSHTSQVEPVVEVVDQDVFSYWVRPAPVDLLWTFGGVLGGSAGFVELWGHEYQPYR
jgi:hypothetical protein